VLVRGGSRGVSAWLLISDGDAVTLGVRVHILPGQGPRVRHSAHRKLVREPAPQAARRR
jgi:hypothetical protein